MSDCNKMQPWNSKKVIIKCTLITAINIKIQTNATTVGYQAVWLQKYKILAANKDHNVVISLGTLNKTAKRKLWHKYVDIMNVADYSKDLWVCFGTVDKWTQHNVRISHSLPRKNIGWSGRLKLEIMGLVIWSFPNIFQAEQSGLFTCNIFMSRRSTYYTYWNHADFLNVSVFRAILNSAG